MALVVGASKGIGAAAAEAFAAAGAAVVIAAMLIALPSILGNLGTALMHSLHYGYSNIPNDLDRASITRYGFGVLMGPLMAALPIFAIALRSGRAFDCDVKLTAEAARLNRIDLDDASVEHNLAYYATLRELSPEARSRAILTPSGPTAS